MIAGVSTSAENRRLIEVERQVDTVCECGSELIWISGTRYSKCSNSECVCASFDCYFKPLSKNVRNNKTKKHMVYVPKYIVELGCLDED